MASSGSISRIDSVDSFLRWVGKDRGRCILYRGLASADFELETSLYRRLRFSERKIPKGEDKSVFIRAVRNLINLAKREKHHRKDGHEMSDLELLAELQHYGAATCLMDFTRSPLVALWFACQLPHKQGNGKSLSRNGKVILLDTKNNKFDVVKGNKKMLFPYYLMKNCGNGRRPNKITGLLPSNQFLSWVSMIYQKMEKIKFFIRV